MTTDARLLIAAGLLALLPLDTMVHSPQVVRVVVGDDEDAAPSDATPQRPPADAERDALEAAARAYLEARKARQDAERSTDPDNQE